MIRSKHGLRRVGLAVAIVLGAFALGAAGAQANQRGIFLYDGQAVMVPQLVINGTAEAGVKLLSKVGAATVEVECKNFAAETTLEKEGEGKSKDVLSGCSVLTPKGCSVAEPIVLASRILALLHTPAGGNLETYIVVEPLVAGGALASIKFTGKECVLPTEPIEIKNRSVWKDCQLEMSVDKQTHLMVEVAGGLGLNGEEGLKFGKNALTIDGSWLRSVGAGHTWAAH